MSCSQATCYLSSIVIALSTITSAIQALVVGQMETRLGDPLVGGAQAGLDADGRLVCQLQPHVQQANGERWVRLRSDPQPELLVQAIGLQQPLFHLQQRTITHMCRNAC